MTDLHTITFSDATFQTEVVQSKIPVLVDFWAEGCGGCRQIAPAIDSVAGAYAGRARVGKIDAMSNPHAAKRYQIRSLPTLLLFKDGSVVAQSVGAIGKTDIEKMLDLHVGRFALRAP